MASRQGILSLRSQTNADRDQETPSMGQGADTGIVVWWFSCQLLSGEEIINREVDWSEVRREAFRRMEEVGGEDDLLHQYLNLPITP